ncbi:MAG TPA: hypothetical protein VHM19_16000, partial [Polyangiales bacterium]|nr:hypothetical protein [Polyangiales bacterium]
MREHVLSLLQACMGAPDALALRDDLVSQLGALAAAPLDASLRELRAARESRDVKVLAARVMRELMQHVPAAPSNDAAGDDDEDEPAPSSRDLKRARAARKAAGAMRAHQRDPKRPAEQPIETLRGVGPAVGQSLRLRGLHTLGDLIWHLPIAYEDERVVTPMGELVIGERQVTEGIVASARGARGRMADVVLEGPRDKDGVLSSLRLVWFRAPPGLISRFTVGARYRVAGVIEDYRGRKQITHAETQRLDSGEAAQARGVVARYSVVPGVPPRKLASLVQGALARAIGDVGEAVPETTRRALGMGALADALRALHTPPAGLSDEELAKWSTGRTEHHERLAFEEFFLLELAL